MGIYTKSPPQMVLDLIKSQNPKFANAQYSQLAWGNPVAGTGQSTTLRFRGKPGQGYTGVATVQYNRLNMATLFANILVSPVTQYNATKLSDLLPRFNELYGTNFTAADLGSDPALTGTTMTPSAPMNSPMYTGTISFTWIKGTTPQIWELYPNRTLTGLQVPTLMLKAFQLDFTANTSTLTAHDTSVPLTSGSSTAMAIASMLAQRTGLAVTLGATTTPGNGQYDLSGFTLSRVTADQLTDSNPNYRKVAVLTPPVAYGNQNAVIYLHYDKITTVPTSSIITATALDGLDLPS